MQSKGCKFMPKIHQNKLHLAAGLRPDPLGKLMRPLDHLAAIWRGGRKGAYFQGGRKGERRTEGTLREGMGIPNSTKVKVSSMKPCM